MSKTRLNEVLNDLHAQMPPVREYDREKVDDAVLALLECTLHQPGPYLAWKGFDWAALDRLHAKGFVLFIYLGSSMTFYPRSRYCHTVDVGAVASCGAGMRLARTAPHQDQRRTWCGSRVGSTAKARIILACMLHS
jgi:hypothetical protein